MEYVMSKADLHERLDRVNEIRLSVKGRKSGRDIPRPVASVPIAVLKVDPIEFELKSLCYNGRTSGV
jgi:hypothetical protein